MHRRRNFKEAEPAIEALEAQWLAQVVAGGAPASEALGSLFQAYRDLFVARLRLNGLDPQEAQDAAQDVWMAVARAAPGYRGEAPPRAYLLGFLKTFTTRHYSERRKLPPLASLSDEAVADTMEQALQALAHLPGDGWDHFDWVRCVRRAFAAFERAHPHLARLLMLRHIEEMSLEEMVERLGGRMERAKAEVFTARNKFRPDLSPCLDLWRPNRQ